MAIKNAGNLVTFVEAGDIANGVSSAVNTPATAKRTATSTLRMAALRMDGGYDDPAAGGQMTLFEQVGTGTSGRDVATNNSGPDTIDSATGSFLTDGARAGYLAEVAGTGSGTNDGIFLIATAGASQLVLDAIEAVTTVAAAAGITITYYKPIKRSVAWLPGIDPLAPIVGGVGKSLIVKLWEGGAAVLGYVSLTAQE